MSKTEDTAELEHRLWREIQHVRIGMLGLVGGPPRHFQPMSAFCDADEGAVWFYARKDSDLVREAGAGHAAMFNLSTKDHDFIACVGGLLREDPDPDRIARFWNPMAAAWFPEGKDDPALTLLRLTPDDAEVWVSRSNPVRLGFEVLKANLTRREPDVGGRAHLSL